MATLHYNAAFDTLAFAQALIAQGVEQKTAEALAASTRDYVIKGLATNDSVQILVHEAKTELKHDIENLDKKIEHALEQMDKKIDYSVEKLNRKFEHEIEKVYLVITSSIQSLKIWMGSIAFLMVGALATLMKILG